MCVDLIVKVRRHADADDRHQGAFRDASGTDAAIALLSIRGWRCSASVAAALAELANATRPDSRYSAEAGTGDDRENDRRRRRNDFAGTDSPIIPYGLGLHVELEPDVHAGLTPFQALQTATVNAAQALASTTSSARSKPASSPTLPSSRATRLWISATREPSGA